MEGNISPQTTDFLPQTTTIMKWERAMWFTAIILSFAGYCFFYYFKRYTFEFILKP